MSSSRFCSWHRVPRAQVDPIKDPDDALAVLGIAVSQPPVDETVVVLLDDARRGVSIVVVDGTTDDDAVVDVVECLSAAATDLTPVAAMIVGSVRPGHRVDEDDVESWLAASSVADAAGIELVEWFVISGDGPTRHIGCARDLLGEAPRW